LTSPSIIPLSALWVASLGVPVAMDPDTESGFVFSGFVTLLLGDLLLGDLLLGDLLLGDLLLGDLLLGDLSDPFASSNAGVSA
jgi:hypothetical protein